MTDIDREYARLWLSEMWAPVPEMQSTKDERADAAERNALVDAPVPGQRPAA